MQRALLEEILGIAVSTGADFAEVFCEKTRNGSIRLLDNKIDAVTDTTISGVGIRAFFGVNTVFASTSDVTRNGLLACARSVAEAVGDAAKFGNVHLTEKIFPNVHPVSIVPSTAEMKYKTDLLREANSAARAYDARVSQVIANLITVDRTVQIANTEGLLTCDRHLRTRMAASVTAVENGENQSGFYGPGRGMGLETFELFPPSEIGLAAARQAITNLKADYCPAGKMTVAIENGFGGVIFHEACGHSLEATSVGIGTSQMCGKLGQKIANEKITAIDDGTIANAWGSTNIDDEGNPTQRNVLIEKGILKKYMVDRLGSRRMGMAMTGNSRRQNYTFEPTSRMTNTYIDNGPDKNEDIIASIEYGLYAKSMGGGSVNPLTGDFNFAVSEGYIIRNGKICEPVRGASLIGNGSQILMDIDMVGQNLDMGQGMCGSSSGSVPTDVGQPLIRVSSITVGGR
ncbi:MAG: TldD/PmbA family protein [Ruminococcaceae bacterium]|nr:TldD/PmbA family protein [Oscillospiraceae bacterium]